MANKFTRRRRELNPAVKRNNRLRRIIYDNWEKRGEPDHNDENFVKSFRCGRCGKKAYDNEEMARRVVNKSRQPIKAYFDELCGLWHHAKAYH